MNPIKVICFGEVLWDLLPAGKKAGGAPMNVAYHLSSLGVKTALVSSVGRDPMGQELLEFMTSKGISTQFVEENNSFPTGTVAVELDEKGSPTYDIVAPVAWDFIQLEQQQLDAANQAELLVYGSLAARNPLSKSTLLRLINAATFRVMDVNLRSPFFDEDGLKELLELADAVKMNEEELAIICRYYGIFGKRNDCISTLRSRLGLKWLIITLGGEGATLQTADQQFQQGIFAVEIEDTIGSGDAFLSAFLAEQISGKNISDSLVTAAAAGAYVAEQRGATPKINSDLISAFKVSREQHQI